MALGDVGTTGNLESWFSRRWLEGIELNAAGFRERELAPATGDGIRIAVVGDSMTFGPGLSRAERYTERMQERLAGRAAAEPRFEVWNFGVPGADTDTETLALERFVLPASPDFVLLQWYVNDPMLGNRDGMPAPLALLPSQWLTQLLRAHSALFHLLEVAWSGLQRRLGLTPSFGEAMRRRFADASSPDARAAEAALRRFAGLCEAAGVPMGIVLFPSLGRPDDFAFLHERVLAFCGEEGLPCLDLRSRFAALGGIQDLRVNRFDAHPGAAAHDAAAEAILRHFSPYW